jgi:hypothetical protein
MYLKAKNFKSFVEIHILNPKLGLNLNPNTLYLNTKVMYKIANHFWNGNKNLRWHCEFYMYCNFALKNLLKYVWFFHITNLCVAFVPFIFKHIVENPYWKLPKGFNLVFTSNQNWNTWIYTNYIFSCFFLKSIIHFKLSYKRKRNFFEGFISSQCIDNPTQTFTSFPNNSINLTKE